MNIQDLLDMKLHEGKRLSKNFRVTRVPGGWIYKTTSFIENRGNPIEVSTSTTFVPEPKKEK